MTEPTLRSPPRRHRRRRAATAAPMPDRLSDLPDDLLHRILSLVPAREAASTAALSRRWRGLWPTPAAAVNLDTRSYDRARGDKDRGSLLGHRVCDIDRDAFFRDAEAALAAHASVRRLAVHVEDDGPEAIQRFMSQTNRWNREDRYIADDVLSHPACRAVEDLSIEGIPSSLSSISTTARRRATFRKYDEARVADWHVGCYKLSLGSVPSEALRVLRISNCKDLTPPPPPAAAFPCLTVLWLQRCAVSLYTLQDMVVASPQLSTLQLECVFLSTEVCHPTPSLPDDENEDGYYINEYYDEDNNHCDGVERFCCPSVTTLVLVNCGYMDDVTIELDMPRVRYFRYRGHIDRFPLKSPPPDVRRVDLHFVGRSVFDEDVFWQFLMNWGNTRILKLKLEFPMDVIAVTDKKRHEELLGGKMFHNLERLELDGQYMPASNDVAVAIGNVLHCCPVVRELRFKLNMVDRHYERLCRPTYPSANMYTSTFLDRKSQLDIHKSVDHFTRRRKPVISSFGEDGEYEVSDIPVLMSKDQFDCLRSSLRRVSLQFRMENFFAQKGKQTSNLFGAQLAKFFIENAVVLEEIYIDDGNKKMWEHMNRKVDEWAAHSFNPCSVLRFNPSQLGLRERLTTTVTVLPLER